MTHIKTYYWDISVDGVKGDFLVTTDDNTFSAIKLALPLEHRGKKFRAVQMTEKLHHIQLAYRESLK